MGYVRKEDLKTFIRIVSKELNQNSQTTLKQLASIIDNLPDSDRKNRAYIAKKFYKEDKK